MQTERLADFSTLERVAHLLEAARKENLLQRPFRGVSKVHHAVRIETARGHFARAENPELAVSAVTESARGARRRIQRRPFERAVPVQGKPDRKRHAPELFKKTGQLYAIPGGQTGAFRFKIADIPQAVIDTQIRVGGTERIAESADFLQRFCGKPRMERNIELTVYRIFELRRVSASEQRSVGRHAERQIDRGGDPGEFGKRRVQQSLSHDMQIRLLRKLRHLRSQTCKQFFAHPCGRTPCPGAEGAVPVADVCQLQISRAETLRHSGLFRFEGNGILEKRFFKFAL